MKTLVRAVSALALLGLAAPALPCPSMQNTTVEAQPQQPAKAREPIAKAEKGAKSQKAKGAQKPAPTAAN